MKATPEGMSAHVWYYFIWSTSSLSAHIWSASQLVYRSFVLTCKCPSLSPCTFCLTCSFTSCCLLFSHICMHAATLTHQHSSGQGVRCTCNCSFGNSVLDVRVIAPLGNLIWHTLTEFMLLHIQPLYYSAIELFSVNGLWFVLLHWAGGRDI